MNAETATEPALRASAPEAAREMPAARALIVAALSALAFQVAWNLSAANVLVLVYAFLLVRLSRVTSARVALRVGFLNGMLVFAPQLAWFWRIFGPAAICLWAVLSAFTGLFVLALYMFRVRFGSRYVWLAAPILWTGLEYFRSELYYLRFSWLSVGYVFSPGSGGILLHSLGVYGCGFAVFFGAALAERLPAKRALACVVAGGTVLTALTMLPLERHRAMAEKVVNVAGIQLEFPPDLKVPEYLDQLSAAYPNADVLVLSEYTFDSSIPRRVRTWCRDHHKYLIAGGKTDADVPGQFYNSAFVVGPDGEIVFEQAKSVPIQFFKDGLPAREQRLWQSPWGRIGICICYDLSYRRVVDRLARAGAQALIVPFMDVADWGEHQHELHTRIAPTRAREYGIPIFRVGSSGISSH